MQATGWGERRERWGRPPLGALHPWLRASPKPNPRRPQRTTTERPTGSLLASASPRRSERPRNRLATARVWSFASIVRLGAGAPLVGCCSAATGRRRRWAVQARPPGLRRVADERGCAGVGVAAPDGRAGALVEREAPVGGGLPAGQDRALAGAGDVVENDRSAGHQALLELRQRGRPARLVAGVVGGGGREDERGGARGGAGEN